MKKILLITSLAFCFACSAFSQEQCGPPDCPDCMENKFVCDTMPNGDILCHWKCVSKVPASCKCQPRCGCPGQKPCNPDIPLYGSQDPNDIIPPDAVGPEGWIRKDQLLPFVVHFENLSTATAPAARVEVTLQFGSTEDLTAFELGDFGFGPVYQTMQQGLQQYSKLLHTGAQVGVNVQVDMQLLPALKQVSYVFQSIDTLTGQPTNDPMAGFLPPNDANTGSGQAFMNFTIRPKPSSHTFETIEPTVSIVFDGQDPIPTPMVLLTVDADAPISTVSPTVTAPDAHHLLLHWSGTDIGSGLKNYTLFTSEDGGDYKPWLVEVDTTAGLLPATLGKTYRILIIARDSVNNVEDKPPFDLEITFTPDLIQGGSQLAAKVLLLGNYDASSGLMKDDLRQLSLIPLVQPYTSTLGYAHTGTESVALSVFATTGNDAIVDWILVELRDKAHSGQTLYSRAALLQRDGDIVDTDGFSPLTFPGAPAEDYYVVIRHRNHIGVGTKVPVAIGSVPLVLDFTDGSVATFGTDAQANIGGKLLLWSGDANGDGKVVYAGSGTDVNAVSAKVFTNPANTAFSPTFPMQGYFREDVNLDGSVKYAGAGTDVNWISLPVFSAPANLIALSPTFVLMVTLP
ncbi:MAG: hypothetical protein GC192_16605 [Bacteroidetes bacterium]|nr:hypothetical protein [Bacteroidota bacterium]